MMSMLKLGKKNIRKKMGDVDRQANLGEMDDGVDGFDNSESDMTYYLSSEESDDELSFAISLPKIDI